MSKRVSERIDTVSNRHSRQERRGADAVQLANAIDTRAADR